MNKNNKMTNLFKELLKKHGLGLIIGAATLYGYIRQFLFFFVFCFLFFFFFF
jgi:hypothetical protein